MSSDCIFCKIAGGEIPAEKVFETEKVVVFKDIRPQAPVHLLVVPKEHIEAYSNGFKSYGTELLGLLFHAAEEAAKIAGVDKSGYRLIVNTGPDSGQEIAHLHMHLLGGRPLGRLVGD